MSKIGGGIASIIKKNIIYEKLTDNNLYISFEHMIIKSTINSINYIFIVIYKLHKISHNVFINEFNKLLFTNTKSYKRIIITGDFNINMVTNNQICIDFNNMLLSYNLIPYINNITRPSSKTLFDNFFTNINKNELIKSYNL